MRPELSSPFLHRSTTCLVPAAAVAALICAISPSAHAHITLMNPPSWVMEGNLGDPQKAGPCGGTEGSAGVTPTGTVTQYTAGEKVMVMWKETVGHPGHFRISLTKPGESRDVLVDPPVVTANGDGVSGLSISAETVPDGTGNVLMDGLFPRESVSSAQAEPFMQEITLPDEPCEKCTLQVIQFMAQHGPGYFYHHCADIEIVAKADGEAAGAAGSGAVGAAGSASMGMGGSASTGAAGAAGSGSTPSGDGDDDDGGCSLSGGSPHPERSGAAAVALFGLAATLWRRRSRR